MTKLKILAVDAKPSPPPTDAEPVSSKLQPLEHHPLFQDLAPEVCQELVRRAVKVAFAPPCILFKAGEPAARVYALVSGRVKLCRPCARGQETVLQLLGPGELCGWPCVLAGDTQANTAKAVEPGHALAFPKDDFEELLQRFPKLARNALNLLAHQVHEVQEHYLELSTEQVPQRLARTLLRLSRPTAHVSGRPSSRDVPLSRAELAQMTGASLFTVSRVLSLWDSQGLVRSRRGHVLVGNSRALGRIAEPHPSSASPPAALAASQKS